MHSPATEIEEILRHAPRFTPPKSLKQRLIADAPRSVAPQTNSSVKASTPSRPGWIRRWWPALIPAAGSIACAVVFTVQRSEILEARSTIQALTQAANPPATAVQTTTTAIEIATQTATQNDQDAEIERLKQLVAQLQSELAQLTQMRSENEKLRTQLAANSLTSDEVAGLQKAHAEADSLVCINNLKQFGLAVRVWALDNHDSGPPTIMSMSNELATPKVLVCPADTTRQTVANWSTFTMANSSYEYLAPGAGLDEPTRVLSRCPVHGHIGLCDGSVQREAAKNHPEAFVEKDGKLYFEPVRPTNPVTPRNAKP
jgi:hypothetical protein